MSKIVVLQLTKHHGSNVAGETAGFTPDAAAHIMKNDGGKKLIEYETTTDRCSIFVNEDGEPEAKLTKIAATK